MTTIASTGSGLSDAEHSAQLRRAVVAGTVGTIIEAYDFLLYVQVAPLVFATLFFPGSDPPGRDAAGVRHLCRRLCRAAGRGGVVRPLRRPDRPQGDADRDTAADRAVDLRGRLRAGLRHDRHLGRGHPDRAALHPGHGDRRRVGRRDPDRDGMGEDQQASRLHHLLAAMGRPRWAVLREHGGAGIQLDLGRSVPYLGLARAVLAQHRHGRGRDLHPAWHHGDAGVPPRPR